VKHLCKCFYLGKEIYNGKYTILKKYVLCLNTFGSTLVSSFVEPTLSIMDHSAVADWISNEAWFTVIEFLSWYTVAGSQHARTEL